MDMDFTINNQKLKRNDKNTIVNKSNNYLRLVFDFQTSDWEDMNKFAILKNSNNESYQFEIINDNVIVPETVLTGEFFFVSVHGTTNDSRITTNMLTILLLDSGYTLDLSTVSGDVSKDIFQQIYEKIGNHTHSSSDILDLHDSFDDSLEFFLNEVIEDIQKI